ncbi:DUF4908 domain-containing protein [Caulobacter segnis]|uniref:DUF4908 domain-containing protein n=1 Tax=Caulobacter segnis TaxID=88688 RepID=UPI0024100CF8|nr:DUF4908 domain-containing protein [Caulobacter segnis]MDG2519931.1 DUF4908 domain-containing protein [Caulobacter segnis]
MVGRRSAISRAAVLNGTGALCVLAALVAASPALAQTSSLREALYGSRSETRRAMTPPSARYVSETGVRFVFDRSQDRPLIRFEGQSEVWALEPHAAPRGDTIYKNDLGQPVLRATKLGGLTVFTQQRPAGAAAAVAGEAGPIRLPALSPSAVLQRLAAASAKASRAAQRLISFEADVTAESSALAADAASLAADAVARLVRRPGGKQAVSKIDKVVIDEGKKPSAHLKKGVVRITVTPDLGLAGRPSSEKIAAAAEER